MRTEMFMDDLMQGFLTAGANAVTAVLRLSAFCVIYEDSLSIMFRYGMTFISNFECTINRIHKRACRIVSWGYRVKQFKSKEHAYRCNYVLQVQDQDIPPGHRSRVPVPSQVILSMVISFHLNQTDFWQFGGRAQWIKSVVLNWWVGTQT